MIDSRSSSRQARRPDGLRGRPFRCLTTAMAALILTMELGPVSQAQSRNTVNAASCAPGDVVNAVNAARAGDIVQVPAGTCTWPSSVGFSKNIWLRGAGAVATVFRNNGAWEQYYNGYLIYWDGPFEMSGITIDGNNAVGALCVRGTGSGLKIHDNTFTHGRGRAFNDTGLVYGVVWNNRFVDNFVDVDSGGVDQAGWDAPFKYGDANTLYVEDNVFLKQTDDFRGQVYYTEQGGRMVLRHNTFTGYIDYDLLDNHGNLGSDTRTRGFVGGEIYDNTFAITPGSYSSWRMMYHRGGQLLLYNNAIMSAGSSAVINLTEEDGYATAFGCPCPIRDKVTNTYFKNNTFNGAEVPVSFTNSQDTTNLQLNRDYFVGSLPAGYTPYTYPHPLRGGSTVGTPAAPSNVRVVR